MGVDVATYRARVGCFHPRKTRDKHFPMFKCLYIQRFCDAGCLKLLVVTSVMLMLLSNAGDVESNPGPPTNSEKIDQLRVSIDALIANSAQNQLENSKKLDEIKGSIAGLGVRVGNLEKKVEEIKVINENLTTVKSTLGELQQNTSSLQIQSESLENVVNDLNNRLRRNNLIFKGLPESDNETWNQAETIIREFVTRNLGVNLGEVERAHRIGRKRDGFHRPIIVKLLNFKSKEEILRNASKLKNVTSPKVSISEDYSAKTRLARQKLWEYASVYRDEGTSYKIKFDKLYVNNQIYVYSHSSQTVFQLGGRSPVSASNE